MKYSILRSHSAYWVSHVRTLLRSRDFWIEYCFYLCYVALLWFVVQVTVLHADIHDYFAVLWLQLCSIFGSALLFVWLKTHYQPSSRITKLGYFLLANGPRLWIIYYYIDGMVWSDLMTYAVLMMIVALVEGVFYDHLFDRCCDWAYRLKTLYRTRRRGHHENH